jgi:hypothetical protein
MIPQLKLDPQNLLIDQAAPEELEIIWSEKKKDFFVWEKILKYLFDGLESFETSLPYETVSESNFLCHQCRIETQRENK